MSTPSTPTESPRVEPVRSGTRRLLVVWAAVSAVAVLSHFAFAPQMGLYEDDHWLIGTPMCDWHSTGDLYTNVKSVVVAFMQGRPLHCGIGFVLAFVSTQPGGVLGAYALAAGVWAVNAGLCLALLWNRFGALVATTAALVFVLLPADTTHPMTHTAFCVHPSVTYLLLSGIAYARGRRVLAVLFSALSLMTYETCFLPALVWPVLFRDLDRPLWRRALVHGLLMGCVLGAVVFTRVQTGENRVTGAMGNKWAIAEKMKKLAVVGPKTSFETFIDRPVWVIRTWQKSAAFSYPGPGHNTTSGIALAAGAAALLALLVAVRRAPGAVVLAPESVQCTDPPVPVGRLLLSGALMVVLSYLAAVTREPTVVDGRMSSIHIGSTLGWGVFFGGAVAGLARTVGRERISWMLVPALAAYFTLLAAFHVYVQREYVRAWIAQGEFWRDVVNECPDVGPGTVILFPLVPPTSTMVRHQDWADCLVFEHLFVVPADWRGPPRAYPAGLRTGVKRGYEGYDWNEVERVGDQLYWRHWAGYRVLLEPGNVILLHQLPGGRYERITGTVRIAEVDFPLKERGGPAFTFQEHKLFPQMFPHGLQPEPRGRVSK